MQYVRERDLNDVGIDWMETIERIRAVADCMDRGDYEQPLKPYLRYGDRRNRIIAMPAYVGDPLRLAGIKWISSFPHNIRRGLPRAHSVTILNETETGRPYAFFHTTLPSIIRTAAVSGLMLTEFVRRFPERGWKVGIVGFGPIGQHHALMCTEVLGTKLQKLNVYDPRGIDLSGSEMQRLAHCADVRRTWEEVYADSDIFITCTTAPTRYIDRPPASGMLLLHVSLRDYLPHALSQVRTVVVDDWDEVCREDTDIERMQHTCGLNVNDCMAFAHVVQHNGLSHLDEDETVLFAPMGMAVFDIGIAGLYYDKLKESRMGTQMDDV